jgi:hypothetical protein
MDLIIPYNDDITLNELNPGVFSHQKPENGFSSKGVNFTGFAYSNRSNRSFTWTGTEAALDSNRYSVFTTKPNMTETYAVAKVDDDNTYITLDEPSVIEHILVANTTYTYLAINYGDSLGTKAAPVSNPNIPNTALKGVWYSYVPGGVKKMVKADKDFFRIIAKGYLGGKQTGTLKFDLACRGSNPDNPNWDYVVDNWYKFSLVELGKVDKVVFNLESSDLDSTGAMRTPAWFCLDGIRLKK